MAFIDISAQEQKRIDDQLQRSNQAFLGAAQSWGEGQETKRQKALKQFAMRQQMEEQAGRPLEILEQEELAKMVDTGQMPGSAMDQFYKSVSDRQLSKEREAKEEKELDRQFKMASLAGKKDKSRMVMNEDGTLSPVDGKQISATAIQNVQEGNNIPMILRKLKEKIDTKPNLFGPVAGRIGSMNPYNTESQTMDADLRLAAQNVGKYMEGGVLRKEDEEKYRKMLPSMTDTPEVAANKFKQVEDLMIERQSSALNALKGSGYDTGGLEQEFNKSIGKTNPALTQKVLQNVSTTGKSGLSADQRQQRLQQLRDKQKSAVGMK
jgi:hypothetical protein